MAGTPVEQLWAFGCAICPSVFNVSKASRIPSKLRASAVGCKAVLALTPLDCLANSDRWNGLACRNIYRCGSGLRVPEFIAILFSRLFAILSRLSSTGSQSCRLRRVASPPPAHPRVLKADEVSAPTRKIRARFCTDCLHRAAKAWD